MLLLSMKDMNIAKLSSVDVPLFNGIVSDLFPGVESPVIDYSKVQQGSLSPRSWTGGENWWVRGPLVVVVLESLHWHIARPYRRLRGCGIPQ